MFINETTFYIDIALAFVSGVGALWCFIVYHYGMPDDDEPPDGFQG